MLIVHAGMHKTGSTSIQHALHRASGDGFHYFDLGAANLSNHFVLLFEDRPENYFALRQMGLDCEAAANLRRKALQDIDDQLRAHRGKTFVFSAERIASAPEAAVQRMIAFFASRFDRIAAYAYVRGPEDYMTSMLQQSVRTGSSAFALRWPRYHDAFFPLIDGLGRENLHLRPYDRGHLTGGDVVADFADWTGLGLGAAAPDRRNVSLNGVSFSFLFFHRRFIAKPITSTQMGRADRQVVERLSKLRGPPFALAALPLREMLEKNAPDLCWIEGLLGAPLPPARSGGTGVPLFGSDEDILNYALAHAHLLEPTRAGRLRGRARHLWRAAAQIGSARRSGQDMSLNEASLARLSTRMTALLDH